MRIDVLTLFPDMFAPVFGASIVKRAQEKGLVDIVLTDFRDYALDTHRSVDDKPYGGGPGMVLMCQPLFDAVADVSQKAAPVDEVIMLTPQGRPFNHDLAQELASKKRLMFIAGHYEGFDERIRTELATMEVSLGDFVLSGGEIPAMAMIDAIVRLIPGVLGGQTSCDEESFSNRLLEYPQYTRPAEYNGMKVPDVLISGNHQAIEKWRQQQAQQRTQQRRPDLLKESETEI